MYLKRIEATGFKSFADKTIIEFKPGITAVVGPNGSGKSNISDAIKWVLGEQSSKSLRGDKMADVIFNGTTERPPLNYAEVNIVLDNSDRVLALDYEEVTFTRRLFRSGESQYLINKQKVRLKDIRDLIMDTGIGSDSLSIISQDKVRAVIVAKNDERRAIIEEAAGVLKYKNRKKETVRNLEHTESNLERAFDILNELENQYKNLERQAKVASEYLEVKGQLEKIEIALYVREIATALKRIQELEKEMQLKTEQIIAFEAKQQKNIVRIAELNQIKSKLDEEIRHLQDQLMEVNSRISYFEGERRALMGEHPDHELNQVLRDNLAHIEAKKQELEQVTVRIEKLQKRLSDVQSELTYARNRYYQYTSEVQSLNTKIELLNDFSNNYYGGVKAVLAAKEKGYLKGIHATVDALLSTDEQYITAIEVALAAATQHIVVDLVEDAKKAITYLKESRFGRATFLPIEAMRARNIDRETLELVKRLPGFIDIAVNLVRYDRKFTNVIQNLLGNVIVCENLDQASFMAKQIQNRYRIITLDGDVIAVGGSMTGGRQDNKTPSLLQQRQKLDEAIQELKNIKRDLPDLEVRVKALESEREQVEIALSQARIEHSRLTEYLRSKLSVYEQLKASAETNDIAYLLPERDRLTEALRVKREQLFLTNDEIQNLEKDNYEINRFNRQATNEMHEFDVEKNRLDVKYNSALEFLNDEYHMTYDYAKANYPLEMDYEIARIRVRNLRRHIERLGPVNLNAIEEFTEVKTRYDQLKQNYDDLVKAKDNILSSIKELDEVMMERFKESFARVNKEFNLVFKQLFNGGHAELVLEDETDLLNTGIDIIAQPPGTRLSNVNLLSGGQKTLTAISLLFAILRVKAMPFVILDECEAALDDANVIRYAEYLKKFSHQSQFIVITHRKGTMEKADTLYGVTMQESGVTAIVSVRFEDTDQYIDQNALEAQAKEN